MASEPSKPIDAQNFLQAMYKEQCDQARQHENMRQHSTTLVLTLSAAIVTGVTSIVPLVWKLIDSKTSARWIWLSFAVAGLFLILLGWFGRLLSLKHYERNRMHTKRAARYRKAIESLLGNDSYGCELRQNAKNEHMEEWLKDFPGKYSDLPNSRLHKSWMNIYYFIIGFGVLICIPSITAFYLF